MMACHKQTLCIVALILSLAMPHAMAADCAPGDMDLDLVLATGNDATSHPIAKCFSSITVSVLDDCTLTVIPNGENNYVPALWSANNDTYDNLNSCPPGASMAFDDATAATATTGLADLLATSIYAEGMTASVDAIVAASGIVVVKSTYLGNEATLKYRSSFKSGSSTGIFATGAPSCTTATECNAAVDSCEAGRHSIQIDGTTTYVCALCASGSYSAANAGSCTKCAAGTARPDVGATSCSACNAGTFATLGSSDCRPCEPGTYQNEGSKSSCKPCPSTWSSHAYGATGCIKCTDGRPAMCTNDAECSATTPGSGGAFTATMANDNTWTTAAGWDAGYYYPELLKPCSPASTNLSFNVDETCAIEIHALAVTVTTTNGKACSDPSNVDSAVMAYYVGTQSIMTRLSNTDTKGKILQIKYASATTVTMSVTAATSNPTAPTGTITGILTVNGGTLAGASASTCPEGTYKTGSDTTLTCTPCDPGYYCPADATSPTECAVGTYSTMGQASCIAASDCGTGYDFNPETNACECAPGHGGASCDICPVNTYSAGGTYSACTDCPTDTFSTAGSESIAACGVCPDGEAKDTTSGLCARCPAGKEPASDSLSCVACDPGYYNPPGTSGAQFDKCQRCEGGKKTDELKTTCTVCDAGTYSIWTSSTVRVPSTATDCQQCPDGGYSAAGAKRCKPCTGGSEKNGDGNGCTKCPAGTSRAPYATGGCVPCPAGTAAKAGASTCTTCSAGQFSAQGAGTCSSCAVDTYSSDSRSGTCIACRSGLSTWGETGATECTGCPVGTKYNGGACVECLAGEFQNREGKKACKKCPIGKFSDEAGSETCELCPPGTYQSVSGSQTCRTCPGGTFSSGGKGSCSRCQKGRYSAPGSSACVRCPAGYYTNKIGSRSCTACPAGSRCPGAGRATPVLCFAGSFQSKPGQTTCIPCPRKTNASKRGATRCRSCPTASTVGTTICPASGRRMLLTRLRTAMFHKK
ncbi:putative Sushi, von Willebrand factor type A, EGF and pentraxin domain-containing protein 1 [Nannochloris sp. 'desiccata']|nr:hypothetical protein KSW81_005035 [Chlorella desiccata (nom. nud.)]KAH7617973.1 putative Sushi, von Willebrand factor type A, EGF and pentraxin domain-containing protein 1 [Chlorella desiccata (nom. nud.)]